MDRNDRSRVKCKISLPEEHTRVTSLFCDMRENKCISSAHFSIDFLCLRESRNENHVEDAEVATPQLEIKNEKEEIVTKVMRVLLRIFESHLFSSRNVTEKVVDVLKTEFNNTVIIGEGL